MNIKRPLLQSIIFTIFLICIFSVMPLLKPPDQSIRQLNHKYPKYQTITPRLNADTVIDSSQLDWSLYIYRFKDISVDEENNIIILTNNSVLIYDSRGKRMKHFPLRRGEGPGEVRQYPQSVCTDRKDNIYLYDGYKYIKYNRRMEFITNIPLILSGRVFFDRDGYILGIKRQPIHGDILQRALVKISPTGKPVKAIARFKDQNSRAHGNTVYGFIHAYSPNAYFAVQDDGIVYGHNMQYRLNRYDRDGNLTTVITLEEKPALITPEEKEKIAYPKGRKPPKPGTRKIKLNFPRHRPFFKNILTDEKNRIYVVRRQSVLHKKKGASIDIFSPTGRYLYRMNLPFEPRLIKKDNLYYIDAYQDHDGDDIYRVKKYRIMTNHQMEH